METKLDKLIKIIRELKSDFYERDEVVEGSVCALITSNHVLILGPPGTAKSQLSNELCSRITGAQYFHWLLTKFTTPEEIFGSISLKGLENDEYRRITTHKFPESHIAFLDEIFKASSSILNSLLTAINERIFFNGTEKYMIPLISLFAASNELPADDDELDALYDRFMLRYAVGYIKEDFRFLKMVQGVKSDTEKTRISMEELIEIRDMMKDVEIPSSIYKIVLKIRNELGRKGILLSDRRYKNSFDLIKANALLKSKTQVNEDHLKILEHILWRDPDEIAEVKSVIYKCLYGYREKLKELLVSAQEIESYSSQDWDDQETRIKANIEAQTKLKMIISRVDDILDELKDRGKSLDEVEEIRTKIDDLQKKILDSMLNSEQSTVQN